MSPAPTDDGADGDASADRSALVLDAMLGTLARHLRFCGYDAAFALDRDAETDDRVLAIARREGRTLVTRDRELAARAADAVLLERRDVLDQLRELATAGFSLEPAERPSRCGRCNGCLDPVSPAGTTPDYAPDPSATDCWRCPDCGQVFWRGSHWDAVTDRLETLAE